ncbi:isochorismate synthase [Rhodoplanes sp. TEM]|uniref:isochorismate synthase n=1 Tax=Rhodoplanes tepidamans TaxID=200616 RepID=A0ABT5JFT4_RHOTP|nr:MULTISPECIES: isochorismate synthase [Rhodoplanes]MDC7788196.1 isochorismate synthase [Rhodoplanes tepidamans]MDC7983538.1 isochorismate synthase [Rhodoplanes sp. TEM]MDQ0354220.1 isochorismate synthase [Rhodoplanes tepidamans]
MDDCSRIDVVGVAMPFALVRDGEQICGEGVRRRLPLAVRELGTNVVRDFLAAGEPGDPAIVVGALPFDRDRPAHLYQPCRFGRARTAPWAEPSPAPCAGDAVLSAMPHPQIYAAGVASALAAIAGSAHEACPLRKVVLARSLVVSAAGGFDLAAVIRRLARDRAVTIFRVPLDTGMLIGATPELLVEKTGGTVVSWPLAGSACRRADPAADAAAARALLASDKDRREHAAVVEAIADGLAPFCRRLDVPSVPSPVATATMWHLGSRIAGELKDPEVSSLELAARLHPTPAVCGEPRERAAALIRELEPFDRGFYAGAIGWTDARGDGRWYVTLRCAEFTGCTARLYAGAGIVPGSDPGEETRETRAKFGALLAALGVAVVDDV